MQLRIQEHNYFKKKLFKKLYSGYSRYNKRYFSKGLIRKNPRFPGSYFPHDLFSKLPYNKLSPTLNLQFSTELIKYHFLIFCEKGNNPSSWGGNE